MYLIKGMGKKKGGVTSCCTLALVLSFSKKYMYVFKYINKNTSIINKKNSGGIKRLKKKMIFVND